MRSHFFISFLLQESDLDMQCDSDEEEAEKSPVEKKIEIQPIRKTEPVKQYVSVTSNVVIIAKQYNYSGFSLS